MITDCSYKSAAEGVLGVCALRGPHAVMLLLLHVWSSAFVRPPTPTLLQGAMACRHTVCGLGRALRRECFCSATVFVAACHGEVSAGSSQVRRQPHWPPPGRCPVPRPYTQRRSAEPEPEYEPPSSPDAVLLLPLLRHPCAHLPGRWICRGARCMSSQIARQFSLPARAWCHCILTPPTVGATWPASPWALLSAVGL